MSFTEEQNQYMVDIHETSNGVPRIAAELFKQKYDFKVAKDTIRARWREHELEIQVRGGYRTESRRKPHSHLYHLENNPYTKYLLPRARKI
ncbi:MAG: hypothetical protein WC584_05180 [Candidatus Pacearchaeota archaeon]